MFIALADGITIRIGNNVWSFGTNLLVFLLIAAIIGVIAEFIIGWRLPFGIIGAVIAGAIGVWLITNVIILGGFGDYYIDSVPLIRGLIGAAILIALWHLLTYAFWRDRKRYYRS